MELQNTKEPSRTPETRHATSANPTNSYSQDVHQLVTVSQRPSFTQPSQTSQRESLADVTKIDGRLEKQCQHGSLHTPPSTPNALPEALVATCPSLLIVPRCLNFSEVQVELLRTASALPPVTKLSLKELDLPCIMHKLALRVDVNYDRDLHFTPARHEKNNPRKIAAERYWEALILELNIYACRSPFDPANESRIEYFQPRLPGLFDTIREVLQTLVPTRDHSAVVQQLDTDLLMQQVRNKVLDMITLAGWLADLLKMHCAPMRDGEADKMAAEIERGCLHNDMHEVVKGLENLFGLLETMKLDVANHQIRTFRILLIEDTVTFLQDRYLKQIERGERETKAAASWYTEIQDRIPALRSDNAVNDNLYEVAIVLHGMCESLISNKLIRLPNTFDDERSRIRQLQADLQDLTYLDVCCHVLNLVLNCGQQTPQTYDVLKTRIWYLVDESDEVVQSDNRWLRSIDAIALEIARAKAMISPNWDSVCASTISEAEYLLRRHFTPFSHIFEVVSSSLIRRLEQETLSFAKRYVRMSPLEISESQRGHLYPRRTDGLQPYPDVQCIARRLAHVVVLHWWIWGPLVYRREPTSEEWDETRGPRPYLEEDDFRMEE